MFSYIAGENYIALADITNKAESNRNLDGFALIGRKLSIERTPATTFAISR